MPTPWDPRAWFRAEAPRAVGFLVQKYAIKPVLKLRGRGIRATFLGKHAAVEVDFEPEEGNLSTSVVLLEHGEIPERRPVRIHLNEILEAHADSRRFTSSDLRGSFTRSALRTALDAQAAALGDYPSLLAGEVTVVARVKEVLADVPGDPQFDWWLDP